MPLVSLSGVVVHVLVDGAGGGDVVLVAPTTAAANSSSGSFAREAQLGQLEPKRANGKVNQHQIESSP